MDGLINTTLVKSAKFDFTSVNLDGNSLFIGANGAGKTTLLRAILFFYTGSSEGLGINRTKKISFADYYFPYENSYIIYTYKKGEKYVLAVAYKDSNIKYYFALFDEKPDIQKIFIEENNKPIELVNLKPKLKEISNLSNIVQNGAKYREILYSKNTKENEYSLFEAKEYESFTRTLSNIFINSKVDSNSIKKVIVSSLNLDTFIDISQLQRFLKDFNLLYSDILLYEKSNKDILKVIEFLKEYEQTKSFMEDKFKTLFSSKEFVQNNIKDIEKELEKTNLDLEKQKSIFQKEEGKFNKKNEDFIGKNATIKDFLKKCDEKKEFYDTLNIEVKIIEFSKKESLESKLRIEISNKEFLTKEHKQLLESYQNQIEKINNSFVSQKNILDKQNFDLQNEQKERITKIEKKEVENINEIKDEFTKKRLEFKENLGDLNGEKKDFEFEKRTLENKKFIFEQDEELEKFIIQKKKNQENIDKLRVELKSFDTKLFHEEKFFVLNQDKKTKEFDSELEVLTNEIEQIQKRLTPIKGSLIHTIYENSAYSSHYLHFLKDEILHSKIDFNFKDFSNFIFELDLKDFEAPNSNLAFQMESLKTKHNQKLKEKTKKLTAFENEFKSFQNKIYKEKIELNESLKELEINLNLIEVKINKLELDIKKAMKDFDILKSDNLQNLNQKIKNLEEKIKRLDNEYKNLESLEQNEIKAKKSEFTKKVNSIKSFYFEALKKIEDEIINLENNKKIELKKQNESFENLLKDKNVDIKKLQEIENGILVLEKIIKEINSYQTIIIEYNKDKKEYLDKEIEYKKEQRSLKEELKKIEDNFYKLKDDFNITQNELILKINKLKNSKSEKSNDIKNILNFEKNPTFERYKSLGFKYESNSSVEDEIQSILNALETLKTNYDNGYKKIQNQLSKLNTLFDNSLGIKKVLDDVQTAYILKEYFEENKISHSKGLLGENTDKIIKYIVDNYDKLLDSQGQIKTLISKITKLFSTINISVIDSLELRYQESNNKIIEIISKIKSENEENSFGFSSNLFSTINDTNNLVKLLRDLIDTIEHDNINKIDLEDSFILEFRVVENGNDSKWLSSLDMIGSNGTDVLVKSMIYIAMLHIFKIQTTKKELIVQAVLDEVGILSQRYLKELIEFANKYGILFVNGAPDEKLIGTYKRVSLISNINSKPVVKELIIK